MPRGKTTVMVTGEWICDLSSYLDPYFEDDEDAEPDVHINGNQVRGLEFLSPGNYAIIKLEEVS